MEISTEQLKQFQAIYLKKFGIELSPEEVLKKSLQLLNLIKIISQPSTKVNGQK